MAKVQPGPPLPSHTQSSSLDERKRYMVWMKSLVLNGNGLTVYDAHGNLAYRIDNYNSKCSSQVFLMDLKGNVLCTLLKKKLRILEQWDGYKGENVEDERRPWFRVMKISKFFSKRFEFSCQVRTKGEGFQDCSYFRIHGCEEKSEFQIMSEDGLAVAEVKRKQASKGVMLGNDVLSLEVEPHVDHSLIMALVVVHGLISNKI